MAAELRFPTDEAAMAACTSLSLGHAAAAQGAALKERTRPQAQRQVCRACRSSAGRNGDARARGGIAGAGGGQPE